MDYKINLRLQNLQNNTSVVVCSQHIIRKKSM